MSKNSKSASRKLLSGLSKDELVLKVRELESQLFQLKLQKETGQLANLAQYGNVRHELSRAKTYFSQKA